MNCEQVKELLSAYLDNTLASTERQRVAEHLEICPECCILLVDFRRNDALLSQLPRVSPGEALRERLFSSPEYLELTGTFGASSAEREQYKPTAPYRRVLRDDPGRPQLVALPGGRRNSATLPLPTPRPARTPRRRKLSQLPLIQLLAAACLLMAVGVGGAMSWNAWQQRSTASKPTTITPPADLQTGGPIPAGIRFVFLRDGSLWSAPTDGGTGIVRLTPEQFTVANNWEVRPALPGRQAGNMLAYIDLQRGFVHVIRSDGQSDTELRLPLFKPGTSPAEQWDTEVGASILNSLSWSKDGSMLAFVADPKGTGQTGLYLYNIGNNQVREVPLPLAGAVSRPVWSPDSVRIAFKLTSHGNVGILDYNTQNQGVLTIASTVATPANPKDTLLSLDWSPSVDTPALTWSTGVPGHVHSIWLQRVGVSSASRPSLLAAGNYAQASYNGVERDGMGSWLVVMEHEGQPGDLLRIDLDTTTMRLTSDKQVGLARWSPDGVHISYLDALSAGVGALHVIQAQSALDTLVATNAMSDPSPLWSADSKRLAYSTGTHALVVDLQAIKTSRPLKLQGPVLTLGWSPVSPNQLVLSLGDGQQGIYLSDIQHDTSLLLDQEEIHSTIQWTQIP